MTPEIYQGGSGSTLVLLHGFGGTWRQWQPLLPLLEPHHRVIAPTLPGHSGGLPMRKPASPVTISEALAGQLRERGIGDAHFVGQSLGGWAVFEMVRHGLARSALGLSPAGAWSDEAEKRAFLRKALATFRKLPTLLPLLNALVGFAPLRKLVLRGEMQHGDRVPAAVVRDTLRRIATLTIVEDYLDENITPMLPLPKDHGVPLRVVWADRDKALPFPSYGPPLLQLLGLDSHLMLKDCGHNPIYDDTQGVAQAILEFTRSVDQARARS